MQLFMHLLMQKWKNIQKEKTPSNFYLIFNQYYFKSSIQKYKLVYEYGVY